MHLDAATKAMQKSGRSIQLSLVLIMHAGQDHTHAQKVTSILTGKARYVLLPIQHGLPPTDPSPQLVDVDQHVSCHTVEMLLLARLV